MKHKPKLVVLSGAGISAESGVATFRDSGGLWEGHNVMDVASPEGWARNQKLVLDFYNKRRQQLLSVKPNKAHDILVELELNFNVQIITQNVDDLHERAGSSNVLHLHGELLKARSINNYKLISDCQADINQGDCASDGFQLRPHIVWFGEEVPELENAIDFCVAADILVVIGTSLQVYPAAGLIDFTQPQIPIYYIDPNPASIANIGKRLTTIPLSATLGMTKLKTILLS